MEISKYKNINNNNIHYIVNINNNDSVVVMLHGFGMDSHENGNFDKLSDELLKKGYDSIRIDLLGHGKSEGNSEDLSVSWGVEILDEILNELNYKKINLLGNSFGGAIVSAYKGKKINKIILWNPLLDLYNNIINPSTIFTRQFFGNKGLRLIDEYGYVEFGLSGKRIGKQIFEEAKYLKPYNNLNGNILIIHGDNDNMVPISQSIDISKNKENVELITIVNGEHGFYNNTINEVIKYTLDFLEE